MFPLGFKARVDSLIRTFDTCTYLYLCKIDLTNRSSITIVCIEIVLQPKRISMTPKRWKQYDKMDVISFYHLKNNKNWEITYDSVIALRLDFLQIY